VPPGTDFPSAFPFSTRPNQPYSREPTAAAGTVKLRLCVAKQPRAKAASRQARQAISGYRGFLFLTTNRPEELAEAELNGRQIRNLTRLAKILYPDGEVTLDQMRGILKYSSA
jgi:hypothetical protein